MAGFTLRLLPTCFAASTTCRLVALSLSLPRLSFNNVSLSRHASCNLCSTSRHQSVRVCRAQGEHVLSRHDAYRWYLPRQIADLVIVHLPSWAKAMLYINLVLVSLLLVTTVAILVKRRLNRNLWFIRTCVIAEARLLTPNSASLFAVFAASFAVGVCFPRDLTT